MLRKLLLVCLFFKKTLESSNLLENSSCRDEYQISWRLRLSPAGSVLHNTNPRMFPNSAYTCNSLPVPMYMSLRGGTEQVDLHQTAALSPHESEQPAPTRKRGRQKAVPRPEENNNRLRKLDGLLQRAAAYSAFLRERLLQTRAEAARARPAAATPGSSTAAVERDPRQPRLVTGGVMRGYQVASSSAATFSLSRGAVHTGLWS